MVVTMGEEKKSLARFIEAVGRRKTAVARVYLTAAATASAVVNDRPVERYFPTAELQRVALEPLFKNKGGTFAIQAHIRGGGIHAQAEAMRHGIARALIKGDPELRRRLKKAGFLRRDSRVKERRKFGLKKARKAPQWSKR